MSGSKAEKNPYWCRDCHGYVVTVHVHDGVTPMFLACRVKGEPKAPGNDCRGMMASMMYPEEPWPAVDGFGNRIPTEPTWEWYQPDALEYRTLKPETREHVDKGGLLLRAVS